MNDNIAPRRLTSPPVPSFSTRAKPVEVEPMESVFAGGSEPSFDALIAGEGSPVPNAVEGTDGLPKDVSDVVSMPEVDETSDTDRELNSNSVSNSVDSDADTLKDGHDGSKYGNAWQIIKFTGIAYTLLWSVLSAAAAGAAAYFFAPGLAWIAVTALGFFTGMIAAVDSKTHLIKNEHTILTAAITVPLGIFVAFQFGWWNLLGGGVTAIVVFATFFLLILFVGFGSGGDIKFSPVPAFVLGVISPLVGALWLFLSLILTMFMLVAFKKKETAFGAGMAVSIPLAIIATKFLFDAAGLAYM